MISTIITIVLIILIMVTTLKDDPSCANCGFTKSAHKNKNKQWHPDYKACNNFVEKL